MKTHVEFTSRKFPSYGTEEEGINYETVYGKRLAEYLAETLPSHGIAVSCVFDEDWGWGVEIMHERNYPLWVGCSSLNDPSEGGAFQCFIHPDTPYIRKWFKKIDVREDVARIADALDAILQQEAAITGIRWWDDEKEPHSSDT